MKRGVFNMPTRTDDLERRSVTELARAGPNDGVIRTEQLMRSGVSRLFLLKPFRDGIQHLKDESE